MDKRIRLQHLINMTLIHNGETRGIEDAHEPMLSKALRDAIIAMIQLGLYTMNALSGIPAGGDMELAYF